MSNPSKRGITIPRKPGTGGEQYKGAIWRKNRTNVSLHELADQFRPKVELVVGDPVEPAVNVPDYPADKFFPHQTAHVPVGRRDLTNWTNYQKYLEGDKQRRLEDQDWDGV